MYARVVDITSKPGKTRELSNVIEEKILSILKEQRGFVDETVLVSEEKAERILAISFWKTREDAQRYERETFNKVQALLQNLTETKPEVRTFNVSTSTKHAITAEKAA